MNTIIFLIVLCAIFYFFKTVLTIVWGIVSFVWGWIKALGYLLFLFIAAALILRWFLN